MFATILHANDGSDHAFRALLLAIKIARYAPRERGLSSSLARHARVCGHPVRRGFSAQPQPPLEYWIARSSRAMTTETAVRHDGPRRSLSARAWMHKRRRDVVEAG